MPSAAETYILLSILALVLLSLPVAMWCWRRKPELGAALAAAPPSSSLSFPPVQLEVTGQPAAAVPAIPPPLPGWYNPYQTPSSPLVKRPATPPIFSKMDAWFAFGLVLMVSILMGPASSLLVMAMGKAPEEIKIEYTAGLFITQIIFQAGIITLVLVWVCAVRRFDPLRVFGIKERGPLMTLIFSILWLIGAYLALILVSAAILPMVQKLTGLELKQQGLVESAPEISDGFTRLLMLVTLAVGAPLMEELIFRGIIFGVALRYFHPVYAVIASSLLFGVIHNNLLSLIPLTLLGAFLAESYRRTRTLAVPILMHAAFNTISFLILMYGPPELRNM